MGTSSMQTQTPPRSRTATLHSSVTIDEDLGVATVAVSGEIDPSTAARFRTLCSSTRGRAPDLVIDMAAVSYCGAAGLAVLCEAEAAARDGSGRCQISDPSHIVRLAIEACGLRSYLSIA